jgi:two-component system phosphate regulon sensor histidine kinase PhoR
MKSRKLIPGPVLMVISILGITAFLLYWLKQSYDREKKSLELKANSSFAGTVMLLQREKLNLNGVDWSGESGKSNIRIFMAGDGDSVKLKTRPRKEIISTINIISSRMKDSLKKAGKKGVIISMNETTVGVNGDSGHFHKMLPHPPGTKDYVFNFLTGIDSLQDSLRVAEIDSAYQKMLAGQRLNVPFTISRLDSCDDAEEPPLNRVTIGISKPVTYELQLGNTFPYLIKRISLPILFSIILLGITILSFVLLYRNLQKQRRLAELKNEFISNITHELKTPIATVGVAIEALKNFNAMENPQRTKEYLDISSNELQRLSLLVDKVLKLSMFEKKEIELKYEPLNLKDIVDEVTASLRLQLEKNNARVSVTQNGDLNLQGDKLHLLSVVFNLIDNAIKYSNGDPSIQIELNGDEQNVELSIKDNGIGIPQEYQNKVFEKFFRVPAGDTHNTKGYGLGLSYAAHVVKKHNGIISVDSQPGLGTRFIISLPKKI